MPRREERSAYDFRKAISLVRRCARRRALRSGRFWLPASESAEFAARRAAAMCAEIDGFVFEPISRVGSRASRTRCGAPAPGSSRTSSSSKCDDAGSSSVPGAKGFNWRRDPPGGDKSVASNASIPGTTDAEGQVGLIRTARGAVSSSSRFGGLARRSAQATGELAHEILHLMQTRERFKTVVNVSDLVRQHSAIYAEGEVLFQPPHDFVCNLADGFAAQDFVRRRPRRVSHPATEGGARSNAGRQTSPASERGRVCRQSPLTSAGSHRDRFPGLYRLPRRTSR